MRGPLLIDQCEQLIAESLGNMCFAEIVATMTVSALRHPELYPRVDAFLRRFIEDEDPERVLICGYAMLVLLTSENLLELQREVGWQHYQQLYKDLPSGHRYYFERAEDAPDNLLMTIATYADNNYHTDLDAMWHLFACLPWLAKAEVHEIYLPAALIKPSDHLESAIRMLTGSSAVYGPGAPVRAELKPGRNALCSCGSGQKYKQCCLQVEA
ncbi:MAG: SEC-C domain-containing protein [Bradymonadaceae bacterium]|nr:SEC-C domain-containing protein [Lujinxingiaceae bacterium]